MNRKTLIQIAAITGCVLAILTVIGIGFKVYTDREINLKTVYIAARDIPPRSRVTEEDLMEAKIPAAYLLDHTYMRKEEIIGKYTEIQGLIPAGSAFYKGMLYEESELPDYPTLQLKKGQAAYTLQIDLTSLGGTISAGQRVDVYVSIGRREEMSVNDRLFEGVRLIAVKDHRGLDLNDPDSSGTPYLAVLALNKEDVNILSAAEQAGAVRLIPDSDTYSFTDEARLCEDSAVLAFIRQDEMV